MQRALELDALVHRRVALDDVNIAHDCAALLVRERERGRVRDPRVDPSPPRVDPQDVLEPEIGCRKPLGGRVSEQSRERERENGRRKLTSENLVEHLDRDRDEPPAPLAHGLVFATRPHGIVCEKMGERDPSSANGRDGCVQSVISISNTSSRVTGLNADFMSALRSLGRPE